MQPIRYDRRSDNQQPEPKLYEKGEYQRQVDKTWGKEHQVTNKDNYRDNLFGAAEHKKPVVMTFGRSSDPACRQHLEALEKAKQQSGGKADFVFVDLDKVDPNSAIGKYAHNEIGAKFGSPLTMVFNQQQGDGDTPVRPERPTHWQRGYLSDQSLLKGIDAAYDIQKNREIKTDRQKGSVDRLLEESLKPFDQQRPEELFKGMDQKQKIQAAWDAIDAAEKTKNPKLAAQVRAMVGLASIRWGAEAQKAGDADLADKHYTRGAEYLLSAGAKNSDIYYYPSFQKALRESQLPGNSAEFLLEKGQSNAKWFYPTADDIRQDQNAYQKKRDEYISAIRAEFKKPRVPKKRAA